MKVESIVEKISQKGKPYYLAVIDGEQVVTWDSKVLNYKGIELPEGWKITEKTDNQGRLQKQLVSPDGQKQFQGGGRWQPKSAEELEIERLRVKGMILAYAKDLVTTTMTVNPKTTVGILEVCEYYEKMAKTIGLVSEEKTYKEPFS